MVHANVTILKDCLTNGLRVWIVANHFSIKYARLDRRLKATDNGWSQVSISTRGTVCLGVLITTRNKEYII